MNRYQPAPTVNSLATNLKNQSFTFVGGIEIMDITSFGLPSPTTQGEKPHQWDGTIQSTVAIRSKEDLTTRYAPFPMKLHKALDDAAGIGIEHILSWHPSGSAFRVHDATQFVEFVMPRYFGAQSKFKSFQRQLNLYGFSRVSEGNDKGYYSHPLFRRGDHDLSFNMKIQKIKRKSATPGSPVLKPSMERRASDTVLVVKRIEEERRPQRQRRNSVAMTSHQDVVVSPTLSANFSYELPISHHGVQEEEISSFAGRTFFTVDESSSLL